MQTATLRAARKRLNLESLEDRLNLSAYIGAPAAADISSRSVLQQHIASFPTSKRIQLTPVAGASFSTPAMDPRGVGGTSVTALAAGATTALNLSSYSAIYNCTYGVRPSSAIVGWNKPGNSSVDYKVSTSAAGTYTMTVKYSDGLAAGGYVDLYVNSYTKAGTFTIKPTANFDTFSSATISIWLPAGTSTIKLKATGSLVYNLAGISVIAPGTQSTPTPAPVSSTPSSSSVSVASTWLNSFTEFTVTGATGNNSISIYQSGSTLTVKANGHSNTYTGTYGEITVKGGSGSNSIYIDSSVTLQTIIYSAGANNTITDYGKGYATIVTVGAGVDTVTGNNLNTSFWVDGSDKIAGGTTGGTVHKITSYVNGSTLNRTSPYVANPSGTGATTRITASLWGLGPTGQDVNQGQLGDCYLDASFDAFALNPSTLRNMAVDLGDGTYAVQFFKYGVAQYERVSADLPSKGPYAHGLMYDHPGSSGNIWAPILEKAYAMYQGNNSYAAINEGWMTTPYADFGIAATGYGSNVSNSSLYSTISTKVSQKKALTVGTGSWIANSAPLITSHAYAIVGAFYSGTTLDIVLRNPWGFDGAGSDSNTSDGYVTLTSSQFKANFSQIVMAT